MHPDGAHENKGRLLHDTEEGALRHPRGQYIPETLMNAVIELEGRLPTAALTDREAERLFSVIRTLKEKGTAILYVSHRLEEILTLTDRVIVLRNG